VLKFGSERLNIMRSKVAKQACSQPAICILCVALQHLQHVEEKLTCMTKVASDRPPKSGNVCACCCCWSKDPAGGCFDGLLLPASFLPPALPSSAARLLRMLVLPFRILARLPMPPAL
jgi:hypothetical protein